MIRSRGIKKAQNAEWGLDLLERAAAGFTASCFWLPCRVAVETRESGGDDLLTLLLVNVSTA